jgi:ribose transport system substrate-binding protein
MEAPGTKIMRDLREQHADILKPDPDNAGKWTIGMSQCNLGEPWRVRMNNEIQKAAEKYPQLKVEYKDASNNSDVQRTQVEEFITQDVDLLIVSPKETLPLTRPVNKVFEAGIPVIILDRRIQNEKYTCFIGGDNTLMGQVAGQFIGYLLQGKGNIVELKGLMTTTPAQERHNGFIQGLKDYVDDPEKYNSMFESETTSEATAPADSDQ